MCYFELTWPVPRTPAFIRFRIVCTDVEYLPSFGIMLASFSRNNFANTDFEFSSSYSTSVSGLAAQAIHFSTPLVGGVATLIVTTFIFLEKGAITPTDTETFNVQAGSVKFNIEV